MEEGGSPSPGVKKIVYAGLRATGSVRSSESVVCLKSQNRADVPGADPALPES